MVHFKERAVFIHVDLLGQEDEAEDLAADCKWPTMQQVRKEFFAVGQVTLFCCCQFFPILLQQKHIVTERICAFRDCLWMA